MEIEIDEYGLDADEKETLDLLREYVEDATEEQFSEIGKALSDCVYLNGLGAAYRALYAANYARTEGKVEDLVAELKRGCASQSGDYHIREVIDGDVYDTDADDCVAGYDTYADSSCQVPIEDSYRADIYRTKSGRYYQVMDGCFIETDIYSDDLRATLMKYMDEDELRERCPEYADADDEQ